MNLFKKLGIALVTLATLFGCGEKEDPNKIHTIVLNNGKIQRTLKIPGGYINTEGLEDRTESAIWVRFIYPSMQPFSWTATPTENSIALLIELAPNPNGPSRSQSTLNDFQRAIANPRVKYPPRYVGKVGIYDVYENEDKDTHNISKTFFTNDKDRNLVSFQDGIGFRMSVTRRYAEVLELRYLVPLSFLSKKLEIDTAVTKFVDTLLQK